jgi:hypothetical protein
MYGLSFLGGEAAILLGGEDWAARARTSLRSLAALIRRFEEPAADPRPDTDRSADVPLATARPAVRRSGIRSKNV